MTVPADAARPDADEVRRADDDAVPGGVAHGWVYALIIVGAVIMLLASMGTWVKRQALDTDNWVATSDELLADDEIRGALSTYLVAELYRSVDVSAELEARLPAELQALAAPLAAALQQPAAGTLDRLLGTSEAQAVWERVNRRSHEALVRVLRDETSDAVDASGGVVTLQLGDLVRDLAIRVGLPESAIDRIPADAGEVTIVRSDRLADAQDAVSFVEWASVVLFFVVLGLFVAAVALARGWRRVALRNVGLAMVVVGLLLLVVQRLAGRYVVDNFVELQDNRDPARAVWWIATGLLRNIGWNAVAVGAVIVVGALVAGPGRGAVGVRRLIAPLFTAHPVVLWVAAAAAFLLLLLWSPLPVLETWWGALSAAVLLAIGVEALRRCCQRDADEPTVGDLDAVRVLTPR